MFLIEELIPKDKFDVGTLAKLKAVDPTQTNLQPILSELFEWIQDINWPIAKELCIILASFKPEDIIPYIQMVLKSGDEGWQYSCIRYLIPKLPSEVRGIIALDLRRVIDNPTYNETWCEIDIAAREIYETYFEKLE
ncbi:DUF5071 domain-containing protein [Paenibacillus albus]|uniref:DUF5071 domain-containing protein n=1 Tax=Paenibacillus albus TaxID=2495582 RepID=A0A3Q8X1L6_9BACL|nr:DUF5071 domain-containing protein [Paenibacillus albus]AZN38323.1 DUF5071 domain-containing protein [Paenibacillus albus]